jgi:hypothetical protein
VAAASGVLWFNMIFNSHSVRGGQADAVNNGSLTTSWVDEIPVLPGNRDSGAFGG